MPSSPISTPAPTSDPTPNTAPTSAPTPAKRCHSCRSCLSIYFKARPKLAQISKMVVVTSLGPPEEGVRHKQEAVATYVNRSEVGEERGSKRKGSYEK